ncbi:MAG TPA: hypothetical protein DHU55_12105 [Blastocatellia bacterium]|nr:hypothetical protein [Blastocatellia bacterium]HCX30490.1 hypothetical protein [Blastocatellia bacterium]
MDKKDSPLLKHTLAELELHEARIEELDIEAVTNFATSAIDDRLWVEASLDQKQRFQRVLFPKYFTFNGESYGTLATCLAFS